MQVRRRRNAIAWYASLVIGVLFVGGAIAWNTIGQPGYGGGVAGPDNRLSPVASGVGGSAAGTSSQVAAAKTTSPSPGASRSTSPTPGPKATKKTTAPPKPAPAPGGKPVAANTGVPAGTTLKVVQGDQVYRTANQVISGLDIHGFVSIRAKNVTLKNSIIRGGTPHCNGAVLDIGDGSNATVTDTEIAPTQSSACLDGVWATDATLRRMNIHGAVDGIKAFDNVTVLDSYIHDLKHFASDPNQGGGPTHNDSIQTFEGNQHIVIRHNNLAATVNDNAAYQLSQDFGGISTDIHIEQNWLDGGGCTLNLSHSGGPPMTGIYITGNRFGRHSYFDCPILVSTKTTLNQNSGNIWDDTGSAIPAPQRHD